MKLEILLPGETMWKVYDDLRGVIVQGDGVKLDIRELETQNHDLEIRVDRYGARILSWITGGRIHIGPM